MSDEKTEKAKGSTAQNAMNVLLVVVCCAIFGLFIYDYLRKNKEISEYRKRESARAEQAETHAKEVEERLSKVKKLTEMYKKTMYENAKANAVANATANPKLERVLAPEDKEAVKLDIARKISADLAPIIAKVNRSQMLTNDKLDKAIADLILTRQINI